MAAEKRQVYNRAFLENFAQNVQQFHPNFSRQDFCQLVLTKDWENYSLMERFQAMARGFYETLNLPYHEVCQLLVQLNQTCRGFDYLFFHDVIWQYGLEDLPTSFDTVAILTTGSSGEFAIRYFLNHDIASSLAFLKKLSKSADADQRRLASEGTRLRLPWGKSVPALVEHLDEIFVILENLKADDSLYVRKSVANNLNDLTKMYPDLVLERLATWKGKDKRTDWVIKTGLRSLIKSGYPKALEFLGYAQDFKVASCQFNHDKKQAVYGQTTQFGYHLELFVERTSQLRLSLALGFQKSNGKISEKIFFLKDCQTSGQVSLSGKKSYTWQDLSTRKHYFGSHYARLLLNQKELARVDFDLVSNLE